MSEAEGITNKPFDTSNLITGLDCIVILEKIFAEDNKKGSLVSYEMVPELNTGGCLGEYYHLNIKYKIENENSTVQKRLFVKTRPYQNPDKLEYTKKSGIYRKETTIYTRVLNEIRKLSLNIWCPKCYLVKPDLLVMENVADLGYEPIENVSKFLNKSEIQAILKGLASMHACSLVYERQNDLIFGDLLNDVLNEIKVASRNGWYAAGLKVIVAVALRDPMFQAEALQVFIKKDLITTLNDVYTMISSSSKYCNVICHRDILGGNVLFSKTDPYKNGAVFVDFQMSNYSPAAIDVLMALYLNMRPRERKRIEKECYKFYYDEFSKETVNMGFDADEFITYDDFLRSLKELCLFGVTYNCVAATILKVPDDYLKDMKLNHPEVFHRFTYEDRTEEILDLMRNDPEYGNYMRECVVDLMEYLLKYE